MKRLTALLLALLVVFCSCGNSSETPSTNENNESNSSESLNELSIPYISNDSLNPYSVYSSVNIAVIPLLYDSLVLVNNNFEAEMLIAEKVEKSASILTVTLKNDIYFSNGNKLTASDVVFSFRYLKARNSYYAGKLSGFSSAVAKGENQVVFTLSSPDKKAVCNLDFPITHQASGVISPVGSGRYVLSSKDNSPVLTVNEKNQKMANAALKEIKLVSIPDNDSLFYAIKTGDINIVPSDLSLGGILGSFCEIKSVNTSNFVYLGVSENSSLNNRLLRKYVSAALDRNVIVSSGNYISSVESSLPLFPNWGDVFSLNLNQTEKDKTLIETIKSNESITFSEGKLHINSKRITLRLLFCEDSSEKKAFANAVALQLSAAGIEVKLEGKNYSAYKTAVANRDYDLYLGEVKLSNSLSLLPLMNSSEFGLSVSSEIKNAYISYCNGQLGEKEFLNSFNEDLPFIPIMFKSSTLAYSKGITKGINPMVSDSYFNLQNLK